MYGYIFLTENVETGKMFIGENRSVRFDPKYFGVNEELFADIDKYGSHKFSTKMLMPYESEKDLMAGKEYWLSKYGAKDDSNFYNSESAPAPKPRKTRKKKSEDDEE